MKRTLLAIELLLLCGPVFAILSLGLLYSPVFIFGPITGRGDWSIGALMIFCGTWGSLSLVNLALHVLRENNWPGQRIQWFGLILGIIACGIALLITKDKFMMLVYSGPIIAVVHLLYLSKKCTQIS